MDSKSNNEKKPGSIIIEVNFILKQTLNSSKLALSKKMIFHTKTFRNNLSCASCKKFKCECKNYNNEIKTEDENLNMNSILKFSKKKEKDNKQDYFLGIKRKSEDDKNNGKSVLQKSDEFIEKNFEESKILDLNMIYNTVSPPSELNEELYSKIWLNKDNDDRIFKKSNRIKKGKSNVFQILNCHVCRKSDNTLNMRICLNSFCKESFCEQCIKNYCSIGQIDNENLKCLIEEDKSDWICYICKGKCRCRMCRPINTEMSNENLFEGNLSKKIKKNILKSNNGNNQEMKQHMVKIDDYVIYENEGPEDEDEAVEDNNNDEFEEKTKKTYKMKKNKLSFNNEKKLSNLEKVCLICSMDNQFKNEILSFKSVEDFLNYLKKNYDEELFNMESEEFNNNKIIFYNYFINYHKNYNNDYIFKKIKSICKSCFNKNLNEKNGFNILFTYLHVSSQNKFTLAEKKEENSFKQSKSNLIETKIPSNENASLKIGSNSTNNNGPYCMKSIDNITFKLLSDLSTKSDIKYLENCEKIELNGDLKKKTEIINTNNNINDYNPNLKLLTSINLQNNPIQNTNQIVNNNLSNLHNNSSNPSIPKQNNSLIGSNNTNMNISSLVNLLQSFNSYSSQEINSNNLLQGIDILSNTNTINNSQQHSKNLNFISCNIGKLVEIISQYNQKHLTQNASMLSNINNLVNTISNMSQDGIKASDSNKNITTKNNSKIEIAPLDSIKESSSEKNEIKGEISGEKLNNDNLLHLYSNDDNKELTSILNNFDKTKNNLTTYMFNVLDELKKQIYSIQYYSLVQKLFISYIFKNLDIFIEHVTNNQALNNINSNTIPKSSNGPTFNCFSDNINSLSDQLNFLKKVSENLAINQKNNPISNSTNIDEFSSVFGGLNQLSQYVNGSLNLNNTSIPNANSFINTNNPSNNTNLNQIGHVNIKNQFQEINNLINKNESNNINSNILNNLNTNTINNNNILFSGNNLLEQFLQKGIKNQSFPQNSQIPSNHIIPGQIIMPINFENNSTKIIKNPANQMFNLNNIQNIPQISGNHNQYVNKINNIYQSQILMQLNSLLGQNANQEFGFDKNNLHTNHNLMNNNNNVVNNSNFQITKNDNNQKL